MTGDLQEAMREAVSGYPQAAQSKDLKYFDYFYPLGSFDSHDVLLVQTVNVLRVRKAVSTLLTDFFLRLMSMLIALICVCLLMIYFVILRPLEKVQKSIGLFKDTKDSKKVADNLSKIRSHNEIAELSADVNAMTKELTAYMVRNEETAIREERSKTELALASKIQTSMLPAVFPAFPDRKDFEIYASMTPAREVGGDFYEFFLVDDHRLCLMIADVSGKGIPAALFMMASKILLENHAKGKQSPAQVLDDVNVAICRKNAVEMFVTVWLGILDLSTGIMTCANAGHEYPILRKPGGRYEIVTDPHGLVLGAMSNTKYREYMIRMEPGASLFLYTDGLTEAVDPNLQMFGMGRVLETLNTDPAASPEQTLRIMKEAVDQYTQGKEPFDDLTMMSIQYNGPEKREDS